jgi:hypothetical protein
VKGISNSIKLTITTGYHIISKADKNSTKINNAGRLFAATVKRKSSQVDKIRVCKRLFGVNPDCSFLSLYTNPVFAHEHIFQTTFLDSEEGKLVEVYFLPDKYHL